jgi:hypothetical protein
MADIAILLHGGFPSVLGLQGRGGENALGCLDGSFVIHEIGLWGQRLEMDESKMLPVKLRARIIHP